MKRPILKAVFTILSLQLVTLAKANETLYVHFDSACMDRMEYSKQGGIASDKFVMYQVNLPFSEKLSLVIGPESTNAVSITPAQALHCGNTIFDQSFVQRINQKQNEVLFVRPAGNGKFYISRVAYASFLSVKGGVMLYQSPRFQFALETGLAVIGENIALNKSNSKVLFEGRSENGCTGEFLFSMSSSSAGVTDYSMIIVPEIGVVEERNSSPSAANGDALRLISINGIPTADRLRSICDQGRAAAPAYPLGDQFTARSVEKPAPASMPVPEIYAQPSMPATTVSTAPTFSEMPVTGGDPCKETPAVGFHIVQKGENLYRIAQRYNISIGQIQAWNELGSQSTIFPCQKIRISSNVSTQPANQPLYRPSQQVQPEPTVQTSNVPSAYSFEGAFTPKGVASPDLPAWKTPSAFHTVQPGETVASIAMHYGYTEYRFRYFNNLAKDELAQPGQLLKTSDCDYSSSSTEVPQPYKAVATQAMPVSKSATAQAQTSFLSQPKTEATYSASHSPNSRPAEEHTSIPFNNSTTEPIRAEYQAGSTNPYAAATYSETPIPKEDRDLSIKGVEKPIPAAYETSGPQLSGGLASRMAANSGMTAKSGNTTSARRTTHLVSNGQSLAEIARLYNTTTENLRKLNNISPGETIIAGQRIYIN